MSTVIAKNVQIGTSGTSTDNFTIFQPATPDGTLRIGNGNTGITTSQVALTSAGNVGIGINAPTLNTNGTVLHINNSTASRAAILHCTNAESGSTGADGLIVGKWSDGTNYFFDYDSYPLVFGNAATSRMVIDTSGNVGIGTSSPTEKLTVAGAISATSNAANFDQAKATFDYASGAGRIASYASTGGSLQFFTNPNGGTSTERARIDSTGNFSITQAPGKYTVDTSGGATSIANGGTVDFSNASGMLVVNNHNNGAVTIYLCGAGSTATIGSVVGTVGTLSYNPGINGYRWTNNFGSTATFGFFFVRTRNNA
jgi:hypothetical protein